jgi:hypothetical protein
MDGFDVGPNQKLLYFSGNYVLLLIYYRKVLLTSELALVISKKKWKNVYKLSKNMKNNSGDFQWYISQSCKISTQNSIYFVPVKNNKI